MAKASRAFGLITIKISKEQIKMPLSQLHSGIEVEEYSR
jgi:hypothetical protein